VTTNVADDAEDQPWIDAFEKRSTEGFDAALAPDAGLNAGTVVKPIVDRNLVKICMATASAMYEHLVFFAQAKSEFDGFVYNL
jgi:hypothetical protein